MTYECNGGGHHIAIIYGSQPCPLCASHAEIHMREKIEAAIISDIRLLVSGCGCPCCEEVLKAVSSWENHGEQCDEDNLRAMCQRCHNRYDREHLAETRASK